MEYLKHPKSISNESPQKSNEELLTCMFINNIHSIFVCVCVCVCAKSLVTTNVRGELDEIKTIWNYLESKEFTI